MSIVPSKATTRQKLLYPWPLPSRTPVNRRALGTKSPGNGNSEFVCVRKVIPAKCFLSFPSFERWKARNPGKKCSSSSRKPGGSAGFSIRRSKVLHETNPNRFGHRAPEFSKNSGRHFEAATMVWESAVLFATGTANEKRCGKSFPPETPALVKK